MKAQVATFMKKKVLFQKKTFVPNADELFDQRLGDPLMKKLDYRIV